MGSINFEEVIYTTASMKDAYAQVVQDALVEWGTEPYNGSISTTDGVVLSPLATCTPIPESQVDREAIGARLDQLSKWGPCEALPVLEVIPARVDRVPGRCTVETSVPADAVSASNGHSNIAPLKEVLTKQATRSVHKQLRDTGLRTVQHTDEHTTTLRAGEKVQDYRVHVVDYQIVSPAKATTRATPGPTETRYFILPALDNPHHRRDLPAWDTGFPTQAKARAALPQTLPQTLGQRNLHVGYEIVSMTRRATGAGLVEHSLDALEGKKTVKVTLDVSVSRVVEPEQVTKRPGWLFYGMAAC